MKIKLIYTFVLSSALIILCAHVSLHASAAASWETAQSNPLRLAGSLGQRGSVCNSADGLYQEKRGFEIVKSTPDYTLARVFVTPDSREPDTQIEVTHNGKGFLFVRGALPDSAHSFIPSTWIEDSELSEHTVVLAHLSAADASGKVRVRVSGLEKASVSVALSLLLEFSAITSEA